MRQSQKVRPELSFGDYDHLRTHCLQIRADSKGKIHRKIEDLHLTESFSGQRLSRLCSRGNEELMPRKTSPKFFHQSGNGKDFTYRNGMHPNHRLPVSRQMQPARYSPQPFRQPMAILPVPRHLEEPVWEAGEHNYRQRRAIKKTVKR